MGGGVVGNSSKRDARAVHIAERQRETLELRKGGATYDEIAKTLGQANRGVARNDFVAALMAVIEEPAKEVLALELSRLDTMVMGLWTKAKGGDVAAIDRVLRIMDRRANYLGLDAPKKNEMTGADGGPLLASVVTASPSEAARLVREAFGAQAASKLDEPEPNARLGPVPEGPPGG